METDGRRHCGELHEAGGSVTLPCTHAVTQLLGARQVRERCLECEALWQQSTRELSHTRETDRLADTNSDEEGGEERGMKAWRDMVVRAHTHTLTLQCV